MTNTHTPSVSQAPAGDSPENGETTLGKFHVDDDGYMTFRSRAMSAFGTSEYRTLRTTVFAEKNDVRVRVSEVTYDFGPVLSIALNVKSRFGERSTAELSIHGWTRYELLKALMNAEVRVSEL